MVKNLVLLSVGSRFFRILRGTCPKNLVLFILTAGKMEIFCERVGGELRENVIWQNIV